MAALVVRFQGRVDLEVSLEGSTDVRTLENVNALVTLGSEDLEEAMLMGRVEPVQGTESVRVRMTRLTHMVQLTIPTHVLADLLSDDLEETVRP